MNSLLLISPDRGSGFKPILSGKGEVPNWCYLLAIKQYGSLKTDPP